MRSIAGIFGLMFACVGGAICVAQNGPTAGTQDSVAWHDPSRHDAHFVTVGKDVTRKCSIGAARADRWSCFRASETRPTCMTISRPN
jgi:hypothetical protein